MAAHGLRDVGDGPEAVANQEELTQLKAQARLVLQLAGVSAAVATALVLVASLTG